MAAVATTAEQRRNHIGGEWRGIGMVAQIS